MRRISGSDRIHYCNSWRVLLAVLCVHYSQVMYAQSRNKLPGLADWLALLTEHPAIVSAGFPSEVSFLWTALISDRSATLTWLLTSVVTATKIPTWIQTCAAAVQCSRWKIMFHNGYDGTAKDMLRYFSILTNKYVQSVLKGYNAITCVLASF